MNNDVETSESIEGEYYIYILECADKSYYTGSTNNLQARLVRHRNKDGSEWTSTRLPIQLVYFKTYPTLLEARRREQQIKGWTRQKKEKLVSGEWGK